MEGGILTSSGPKLAPERVTVPPPFGEPAVPSGENDPTVGDAYRKYGPGTPTAVSMTLPLRVVMEMVRVPVTPEVRRVGTPRSVRSTLEPRGSTFESGLGFGV